MMAANYLHTWKMIRIISVESNSTSTPLFRCGHKYVNPWSTCVDSYAYLNQKKKICIGFMKNSIGLAPRESLLVSFDCNSKVRVELLVAYIQTA